ncbi:MAG TPA: maleylpyruvate isomerase N-terminal domain-containing protein [Methylomirabilota bacterium]|nr:maleylpyruvate isomerase N-terminal domain-containing protein [Methylomirabilota bacterium]
MPERAPMGTQHLVDELVEARNGLFEALSAVAPESMTTPGLVGDWSGRELVAHLGYCAGHAVEAIHAVETGRADEFGVDEPSVDEVNATVARVAVTTDLAVVQRREAASFEALVERLRGLDPALLPLRLPDGGTLEDGIRGDGSAHYRQHADELRRALDEVPRG